jgi:phosphatidate cytidylyltransferase
MHDVVRRSATGVVIIGVVWITLCLLPPIFFTLLMLACMGIILCFEMPKLLACRFLLVYPVLPFLILLYFNHSMYHPLLIFLFVVVFSFDTGSYLVGSLFGRHRIAARISPGKTWEGCFGGWGVAAAVTGIFFSWTISWLHVLVLVGGMSCVALMGDLFESALKRRAQLKDSGLLLPGHGGLLDRFDSILFVAYFVYLAKDYVLSSFTIAS